MDFDALLDNAPESSAVFAIFAASGDPYLARTTNLRFRLRRLLSSTGRLFTLRSVAERVEFTVTASRLETALTHYEWAKRYFPRDWSKRVKLPHPAYVKLLLANDYPRTHVTARLGGGLSRYFGPFRTRAQAEAFESKMLDLFQVRRCQEDLEPSPSHPGCIYGEMNLCLRPCQQAVTPAEYRAEASRLEAFLATGGTALVDAIGAARDRASDQMEFEEAQRQHRRLEKVEQVLKLRDELCAELDHLRGIAVLPSSRPFTVRLQPFLAGWFQPPVVFALEGAGESMDARLRHLLEPLTVARSTTSERQEHLALLAQWFYSSHRDGAWIPYPISYRKLVRAISGVANAGAATGINWSSPSSSTPPAPSAAG